jgi:hypothetical protein
VTSLTVHGVYMHYHLSPSATCFWIQTLGGSNADICLLYCRGTANAGAKDGHRALHHHAADRHSVWEPNEIQIVASDGTVIDRRRCTSVGDRSTRGGTSTKTW